ncbi:MAG TPA: hypothetical protein V6D18_03665 [Thermosynechococcaceae cyanobacterium]
MLPGSHPVGSPPRQTSKLAHLFGIFVAVLTLTLPAIVIASYSTSFSSLPAHSDSVPLK